MQVELYRGTEAFTAELAIDPDTGEIGGDYPLDVLVQRNPIGTCAYVLNTLGHADMIDAHIKIMQAKKSAMLRNAERAKEALKVVMQATGATLIKSNDGLFQAKLYPERDESVDVFDALQLPADYTREIPAKYEPDKTLIKKAIHDGFDVPGARIVKRDRLSLG